MRVKMRGIKKEEEMIEMMMTKTRGDRKEKMNMETMTTEGRRRERRRGQRK